MSGELGHIRQRRAQFRGCHGCHVKREVQGGEQFTVLTAIQVWIGSWNRSGGRGSLIGLLKIRGEEKNTVGLVAQSKVKQKKILDKSTL